MRKLIVPKMTSGESADVKYINLLKRTLAYGVLKADRTGVGTISTFGVTFEHSLMREGFPLLTTKKMFWRGVAHELFWFLNGDSNIRYLLNNNVKIWTGDAYKRYSKAIDAFEANDYQGEPMYNWMALENDVFRKMTVDEFERNVIENDAFATKWGELGPIYGVQWRNWNGHKDQIADLVHKLRNAPDDRRMLVSAWNVSQIEEAVLPPCHYGFQCWTRELSLDERVEVYFRENKESTPLYTNTHDFFDHIGVPKRAVSLMWNQRSCDSGTGIPMNIASYALLLCMLAQQANMVPDKLMGVFGDFHIYTNHLDSVRKQLSRDPNLIEPPGFELTSDRDVEIDQYKMSNLKLVDYQSMDKIHFELNN